jgi:oligogalacturonide transport system substrate-binding protein
MVAEANSKVLAWGDYQLDSKFEYSSLTGSDGVYYDVFGKLSYDNYTVEQAADALIEGVGTTLSK